MFTRLRQRSIPTPPWMLLLLTGACGIVALLVIPTLYHTLTTPSPRQILQRWADATQQGDYTTAESYMQPDFLRTLWQDRTTSFMRQGRMGMYHILQQQQTGQSLTATLYWHTETGSGAMPGMANDTRMPASDAAKPMSTTPLCMQVQVGPDGKVTPLTDYHDCTAQELQ